ncbi:MAG: NADH-quinone oxidoreductase subunit NuoG [Chloroflexi bacterium]|nr:NADH-quinone oxidoreductase subunit NuoG [Chloroflexota bacterium]MCY4247215.1 NADH-quinone oxidoreductase subunit NuoG [Chloroflexota bacterium]
MSDTVTINIDGTDYEVAAGANLVDAAKWHAGNDIPVFCYHPKMDPVGMCRMCLVELGMPGRDRATGELLRDDDGSLQIRYFPKLQTACTTTVSDGMHIKTNTQPVIDARNDVLEFLLSSHPLDCPICDKGGECPLQNLTMRHGPQASRMYFEDKQLLEKHYPLGDLIFLDRERCIQCARCVRFQDEVVGDDVLAFHERGRRLQIITHSDPGFATYFSGNTTDICPVGALTTADFRFGARPWELSEVPSISPWDAAGENISLSMRLDRDFGGKAMIKRVMPRQNEWVNEIWISDKTRFGHHFTRSEDRLQQPQMRTGGTLRSSNWEAALAAAAATLQGAGGDVAAIAGSGMANEDLWALRQLLEGVGGGRLGAWPPTHGAAPLVEQVGVGAGTNLSELGRGDAILVIACDLEEEVPIWRLRLKQAQDRGAYLVVANARDTRLEDFAVQGARNDKVVEGDAIRYAPGEAAAVMRDLQKMHPQIAERLASAANLVIVTGAEGLSLAGSEALAKAAANFLVTSGHVGSANNGLLSPLPGANGLGLHYLGFTPQTTLNIMQEPPRVLIVAQAELLDDDPSAQQWLSQVETIIYAGLFDDGISQRADFILPLQSFAERDGSFVNGERRVQRFYTAQGPMGQALPAWKLFGGISQSAGIANLPPSAAAVMLELSGSIAAFAGARYKALSQTERQFPDVGGRDQYYGGTAYANEGGIGWQIPATADRGETVAVADLADAADMQAGEGELLIMPITRLYNRQRSFRPSLLVEARILDAYALIHPDDAANAGIIDGDMVEIVAGASRVHVRASVSSEIVAGGVALPRHLTDAAAPLSASAGTISRVAAAVGIR